MAGPSLLKANIYAAGTHPLTFMQQQSIPLYEKRTFKIFKHYMDELAHENNVFCLLEPG